MINIKFQCLEREIYIDDLVNAFDLGGKEERGEIERELNGFGVFLTPVY